MRYRTEAAQPPHTRTQTRRRRTAHTQSHMRVTRPCIAARSKKKMARARKKWRRPLHRRVAAGLARAACRRLASNGHTAACTWPPHRPPVPPLACRQLARTGRLALTVMRATPSRAAYVLPPPLAPQPPRTLPVGLTPHRRATVRRAPVEPPARPSGANNRRWLGGGTLALPLPPLTWPSRPAVNWAGLGHNRKKERNFKEKEKNANGPLKFLKLRGNFLRTKN